MKLEKTKLQIAMARACMNTSEIEKKSGMKRATVNKAVAGTEIRPATAGRIAKALGVDVTEIVE